MSCRKYSRAFCWLAICALLALAGCKGHTHITGIVKNKWGSPIYLATVTLTAGEHKQQTQTSLDGKFEIALEHTIFKTDLKLTVTKVDYQTVEKSFSSKDGLETIALIMQERPEPTLDEIRKSQLKGITLQDAKELAELMCSQLPNAAAFPLKSFLSGDDVHDTLVLLGGVAQPCLVDQLAGSAWMPDARMEPKAVFHSGDAALWILSDAGLNWDVVAPLVNQKNLQDVGVFEYFDWVNRGNHRKVVQQAVRKWLREHPQCCGSETDFSASSPQGSPDSIPRYKISDERFMELQRALVKLKPGMAEKEARRLLGPSDMEVDLSKYFAANYTEYEKTAAYYILQTHSAKPAKNGKFDFFRPDPLRDRYIAVFFSGDDKFVRVFSNVPGLPPIYPRNEKLWYSLFVAGFTKLHQ